MADELDMSLSLEKLANDHPYAGRRTYCTSINVQYALWSVKYKEFGVMARSRTAKFDRVDRDQPMNPLQRLIQHRLREHGWSYGDVARSGGLPRSTVYTLATTRNLVRPPRAATIDALARGLDVPVSAVRAAAAESAGLHYYDEAAPGRGPAGGPAADDQERDLLIASIDELSPEDRRHVAALVESLRSRDAGRPAAQ
jgi:transcriptional regulator with XRE-family HTH domain